MLTLPIYDDYDIIAHAQWALTNRWINKQKDAKSMGLARHTAHIQLVKTITYAGACTTCNTYVCCCYHEFSLITCIHVRASCFSWKHFFAPAVSCMLGLSCSWRYLPSNIFTHQERQLAVQTHFLSCNFRLSLSGVLPILHRGSFILAMNTGACLLLDTVPLLCYTVSYYQPLCLASLLFL